MRFALVCVFVVLAWSSSASAALIPYHRMEDHARNSSDIVLCDEMACVTKQGTPSGNYTPTYYEYTVSVVRALKGDRKPGEKLVVEMGSLYSRWLKDSWPRPTEAPPIPLGRVLLFLNREDGVWRPVSCGVKLLIGGEVYCYGQFVSNPGGLWLARMAPENISIPSTEAFDEGYLLADVGAALERAKTPRTDKTYDIPWREGVIRTDYKPAPKPSEQPAPPATTTPTTDTTGWWVAGIGGGFLLLVLLGVIVFRKRRGVG